jgi:thiol-disulfide isomerase/thioredoxin
VSGAGSAVLFATLAVAALAGLALRVRTGRVRTRRRSHAGWRLAGRVPDPGERVLLLQVSAPVCAPCRRAATLLGDLAGRTPGLAHVEVDVAQNPEVATELEVMRTPTVVAFDATGAELLRVSGVPRLRELEAALAPALGTS